nr:hypothetical protein [Tanacetum cinerariifolium]
MINCIKHGDQPLPRVTQMSIPGTSSNEQPPLKGKSMWSDQKKKIQKIDRLARSLLIQRLPNDIYSFIDSNKTAKDLWDVVTDINKRTKPKLKWTKPSTEWKNVEKSKSKSTIKDEAKNEEMLNGPTRTHLI